MGFRTILEWLERFGFDFSFQAPQPEAKSPAFVSMAKANGSSRRHIPHLAIDLPLALVVLGLVAFGLLMMFSASADFSYMAYGDPTYSFRRQVQWVGLGLGAALLFSLLRYQTWKKLVLPGMAFTLLLLVSVFFVGEERLNATRSLSAGSYQPSELAKLMIVIYMAAWLCSHRESLGGTPTAGLLQVGAILGGISILIAMQPDFSAVLTVIILGMMLYFVAGGLLLQFLFLAGVAVITAVLVATTDIYLTGRDRIESFIAGLQDLMQSSDHVQRSIESFARGGWFGVGIGQAEVKLMGLPFPHTDSIFAVIGEETGVVGATLLVLAYLFLFYRGMRLARRAPDDFGRLLGAGLSFWLLFEAMLNMAVMVGLLPFAGNALPFISAGGSSMLFSLCAVGILLNLSRQVERQDSGLEPDRIERGFYAIVDMRRWDRRRGVSRAGRSAGAPTAE